MFQIRLHGRGGQGVVTAAEMLALAGFMEGHKAQAFPSFGSERTGAPVVAFARLSSVEIRLREPIQEPDVVLIQDRTLLESVPVFSGLQPEGYVLINSSRSPEELGLEDLIKQLPKGHVMSVPATNYALESLGRPLPGAGMLAGFAAITGSMKLESVQKAYAVKFAGRIAEANAEIARLAYEAVLSQKDIVENLGLLCRKGVLQDCEYINVESEFAAMSVAIGASVAGGRAYTATASQGLLYMAEAVYNASGLGLPVVMTVANRAIGAPINIWNDHSDSMSQRDCGWIQLFAETNQEACDLHIQAFRIAEELSIPVMVCMDGFVLTHAFEAMDIPDQADVDVFLPPYSPRQVLDPDHPYSIGAMVGPEAFTEVRWLAHEHMLAAIPVIERTQKAFQKIFGRNSGGLLSNYCMEDAELAVFSMGALTGTIKDAVDEMREAGQKIGVVTLKCFRPFPFAAVREALRYVSRVLVIERMMSAGGAGAVSLEVMKALKGTAVDQKTVYAGLGGRSVSKASFKKVFGAALRNELQEDEFFLDLDRELLSRQLEREKTSRHIGPLPEALNRHVNERKLARGEEI